jgi:transposase
MAPTRREIYSTKSLVTKALRENKQHNIIIQELANSGVKVTHRTLKRWISKWREDEAFRIASTPSRHLTSEEVDEFITTLFTAPNSTDETISRGLFEVGYQLEARGVRKRRERLGLRYRDRQIEHQIERYIAAKGAILAHIEEGAR